MFLGCRRRSIGSRDRPPKLLRQHERMISISWYHSWVVFGTSWRNGGLSSTHGKSLLGKWENNRSSNWPTSLSHSLFPASGTNRNTPALDVSGAVGQYTSECRLLHCKRCYRHATFAKRKVTLRIQHFLCPQAICALLRIASSLVWERAALT